MITESMEQRSRDRTGAGCITRETGVHGRSGLRQQSKRVVPRIYKKIRPGQILYLSGIFVMQALSGEAEKGVIIIARL